MDSFCLLIGTKNRSEKSTCHLPYEYIHFQLGRQVKSEALPRKTTHFSNSSFQSVHLWFYWEVLHFHVLSLGRVCRLSYSLVK